MSKITEFGKWLGKENAKTMISELSDHSAHQFRAAITVYCCLFDIEVDTREWDELIDYYYEHYNSWFSSKEEFDLFMSEDLV